MGGAIILTVASFLLNLIIALSLSIYIYIYIILTHMRIEKVWVVNFYPVFYPIFDLKYIVILHFYDFITVAILRI